jgi:hypothetical protein
VGEVCDVVGHGPQTLEKFTEAGSLKDYGLQRTGQVSVTRVAGREIDVEGITGSIAAGDYDAFLVCAGKVTGVKDTTIGLGSTFVDSVTNGVRFESLANATAVVDDALGPRDAGGAGADGAAEAGPPPQPGE